MKLLLLISFLFSVQAQADFSKVTCPHDSAQTEAEKDAANRELGLEFVKAELSGWRLAGDPSLCLDQKLFKYFPVGNFGVNEGGSFTPESIDKNANVEVEVRVVSFDGKDSRDRQVHYFRTTNKGKQKLGTLYYTIFPRNPDGKPNLWRRDFGCASVIAYPEKMHVWNHCKARKP